MADRKIIDIAGPEDSKVDIGSKPMIIGHKSTAVDPMVKSDSDGGVNVSELAEDPKQKDEDKPKLAAATSKEIKVAPLKDNDTKKDVEEKSSEPETSEDKSSEKDNTEAETKDTKTDQKPVEEKQPENKPETTEVNDQSDKQEPQKDNDKKPAELDPTAVAMERDQKVRELIDSKKYFVSIKKPARKSGVSWLWLTIMILVITLAGIYLLIDSGKIDLGFKLPFSILNKADSSDNSTVTNSQTSDNNQESTKTPVVQDSKVFEIKDFKFSLEKQTGWTYKDTSVYLDGTPSTIGFEITSPTGSKLTGYSVTGKGGDCQPDDNDVPHDKNNNCATYEELSRTENTTGYLIKAKYTAPSEDSRYVLCYRPKYDANGKLIDDTLKGDAQMGFLLECGPDDIFFTINDIDNTKETYFDNTTVMSFEDQILKIEFNKQ